MNGFSYVVLLLFIVIFSSCNDGPRRASISEDFKIGGICIDTLQFTSNVKLLDSLGMNTIHLTHYLHQENWFDGSLSDPNFSPDSILVQVEEAKKRGLDIVFALRIHLNDKNPKNAHLWHGFIMPLRETDLQEWFARYSDYVLQWARFCEENGVQTFVIGSELNTLVATTLHETLGYPYSYFLDMAKMKDNDLGVLKSMKRELSLTDKEYAYWEAHFFAERQVRNDWARQVCSKVPHQGNIKYEARQKWLSKRWRGLIKDVRNEYSGKISYAANFDNFSEPDFWRELDYLSINAYFPMDRRMDDCKSLACYEKWSKRSWLDIFDRIDEFKRKREIQLPVLFTELGYTFKENSTIEPWKAKGYTLLKKSVVHQKIILWESQNINFLERAGAFRGLYAAYMHSDFDLAGILYWKLAFREEEMKIEPFALWLQRDPMDSLQRELLRFAQQ